MQQQPSHDTTVVKVKASFSPHGQMGQTYLASGKRVAMRCWTEDAGTESAERPRDYETVGYVISGRAELHLEDQVITLEPGDSWLVPRGTDHRYRIIERFTAVEATSPPGYLHGRDE